MAQNKIQPEQINGAGIIDGLADDTIPIGKISYQTGPMVLGRISSTGIINNISPSELRTMASVPESSGFVKITVGTTEPTSPSTGDLWVDTN